HQRLGLAPALGLRAGTDGLFILSQTRPTTQGSIIMLWSSSSSRCHRLKSRKQLATSRPRLELLEDRWVPATLTVLNNLDSGPDSLRALVGAASAGDTVVFAKSVHAITLTGGEIAINKDLTIAGPGANRLTISGNDASRVFDITGSSTDVAISDLTIAH